MGVCTEEDCVRNVFTLPLEKEELGHVTSWRIAAVRPRGSWAASVHT